MQLICVKDKNFTFAQLLCLGSMIIVYSILLFLFSLIGGSIPLWSKRWNPGSLQYLLAFSGAFLLSITFLHLIPESVHHLGTKAGALVAIGFFLQLILQRMTHGMEHGHIHLHKDHHHKAPIWTLFIGLSIHALSEGLPLGANFEGEQVTAYLFLAIGLHKLPEAMLITALLSQENEKHSKTWQLLIVFSLLTPVAAVLTHYLGISFHKINTISNWLIPLVAGSFVHIATTIFYESGTRKHELSTKKWFVIFAGLALGLVSLIGHQGHTH